MSFLGLELLWSPPAGLPHAHDPVPVAISVFVAVLASYTALSLSESMLAARRGARLLWLLATALALGGGIWTMHFTAMLAFVLPLPVAYDPWLTLLSCLVAVVITGLAFAAVARFGPRRGVVAAAGCLAGLGIASMHYIGMAAMQLPGHLSYDAGLFLLSILIACLAAAAALWIAFRGTSRWERPVAAVVMGLAISSMHYTGMAAAHFHPQAAPVAAALAPAAESGYRIALAIGFAVSCLLGLALFRAALDRERAGLAEARLSAIEQSRAFVEGALEGVSDAVLVLDRCDRLHYAAGREWAALEGRFGPPQGGALPARLPEPARGRLQAALAAAWRDGEAGPLDLALAAGEGEAIYELSLRRLASGGEALLVATLHNVTARAGLLQALEQARASAEESDRMKSGFLAAMSHELRTPLNAVIGFSELMHGRAGQLSSHQVSDYADDIRHAGRQLLAVVESILDFARVSGGQLRLIEDPVEARALIEAALRPVAALAEARGVVLSPQLPPTPASLLVDARQLQRALTNLLENAIDFSVFGASVEVGLAAGEAGEELALFVRDQGPGIEPAVLSSLSQPFVQLDPLVARGRKGLGLGLALARGIVEAHDGRLEIDSRPGEGTLVRLLLPGARRLSDSSPRPELRHRRQVEIRDRDATEL